MDLPLFPLRVVLLPGMDLPLHIFEPRYQAMLSDVLAADERFGVVLIREGSEVGETAVPYAVGTMAEVRSTRRRPDGSLDVTAVGSHRFRTRLLHHDRPYLHATVEVLQEGGGSSSLMQAHDAAVRDLLPRYMLLLSGHEVNPASCDEVRVALPADSATLGYLIASVLRVHLHEVQSLLEAGSVEQRLAQEVVLLRREVALLQVINASGDTGRYFTPN